MATDLNDLNKDDLLEVAAKLDIKGRSSMDKKELISAITEAGNEPASTNGSEAASPTEGPNSDDPVYKARVVRDEAQARVDKAKVSLDSAEAQRDQGGHDIVAQRQAELDQAHEDLTKARAAFDKKHKVR